MHLCSVSVSIETLAGRGGKDEMRRTAQVWLAAHVGGETACGSAGDIPCWAQCHCCWYVILVLILGMVGVEGWIVRGMGGKEGKRRGEERRGEEGAVTYQTPPTVATGVTARVTVPRVAPSYKPSDCQR